MELHSLLLVFLTCFLTISVDAQSATPTSTPTTSITSQATSSTPAVTASSTGTTVGTSTSISSAVTSGPPDVYLNVPQLSVGRIELDVDNLAADTNLNAAVAGLVSINAGVQVSIQKVNLTIVDVEAELELIVHLGNLVEIVSRVFQSLNLNPLLITALNDVTSLADAVVGAVDSLLGSITQGGTTLSFIVDNLGDIVQEVAGATGNASTIVGNYLTNMTFTGTQETLSGGFVQKTYSYSPLNALVNIIFNTLGQVVQATVVKNSGTTTSTTTVSSGATASATASIAGR